MNNRVAADHCLAQCLEPLQVFSPQIADGPKPYWKIADCWEATIQSTFMDSPAEAVFQLLRIADTLASGWHVTGPTTVNGAIQVFEGVFSTGPARSHVAGLEWASFSAAS